MTTEKTYHLIDDYLGGKLFGRKLDNFKAELKVNTQLQEQVALQQAIIEQLEVKRKAELKAYLKENVSKSRMRFLPNLASALGAAALVAMMVAAYFIIDFVVDRRTNQIVRESKPKMPRRDTSTAEANQFFDSLVNDTQTLAIQTPEVAPIPQLEEMDVMEEEDDYTDDAEATSEIELNKDEVEAVAPASDMEIKKDVLLSSRKYAIAMLYAEERDEVSQIETISAKKPAALKKNKERLATDSADEDEVAPEFKPAPTKSVNVEYWQSVVNYKGYNYDGKKLKLYGVPEGKKLEFKELDGRLYLKMDSKVYYMEKNTNYNRLVELSNPTLLNILNE